MSTKSKLNTQLDKEIPKFLYLCITFALSLKDNARDMNINYLIESGLLEQYAKHELSGEQALEIEELLQTNLELGEALEQIYIRLENNGENKDNNG